MTRISPRLPSALRLPRAVLDMDYLREEWGTIICEVVHRAVLAVCSRHAQYAGALRCEYEESDAVLRDLGFDIYNDGDEG